MSNVLRISDFRGSQKPMEKPHSSGQGLVFLHRKIRELPFYRTDSEAVHLWVHLIMGVNHEAANVTTEFGEYPVDRGQTITGRNTLARETGIEPDRIKYLLNKFEKMGMITTLANRKFTVLTVTKYDDYQQFFVPTECQQSANANPYPERPAEEVVPTECQQSATKNLLVNNLLSNDSKYVAQQSEKSGANTPRLSCEEVLQALRECVPDARGWKALTPKRRQLIQKFWREAKPIAKQFGDTEPFGMKSFRQYLEYLHSSCRWMFESRPDQKTGKTWQKRNFDFILNAEIYAQVREGDRDDR